MNADFTDPHFAFVWPSYALLALVFAGLSIAAFLHLSHWARRAKAEDETGRST